MVNSSVDRCARRLRCCRALMIHIPRVIGSSLLLLHKEAPFAMIRLEEVTIIHAPIQRCFDLARSVEVHLVANIHSGEQAVAFGGITSGLPELSQQVTWRAKHFGFWQNLTSEYTAMQSPTYFQTTMVKGIFRSMQA